MAENSKQDRSATFGGQEGPPKTHCEFGYPKGVAPTTAVIATALLVLAAFLVVRGFCVGAMASMCVGLLFSGIAYVHSRRIGIDETAVYERGAFHFRKRIRFADVTRARYSCLFGKWVLYSLDCSFACSLQIEESEKMMAMLCARIPEEATGLVEYGEEWTIRTCAALYSARIAGAALGCACFGGIAACRLLRTQYRLDDEGSVLLLLSAALLAAFVYQRFYLPVKHVFGKDQFRVVTACGTRLVAPSLIHSVSIEIGRSKSRHRVLVIRFLPLSGERGIELAEYNVDQPLHLILRKLQQQYGRHEAPV